MALETFSGSLIVRERIAISDVTATIKLVAKNGDVLAATALQASGVPVEFSLEVDPEILETAGKLSYWAYARSETGAWGTLELVKVNTKADSTDVVLSRVDA